MKDYKKKRDRFREKEITKLLKTKNQQKVTKKSQKQNTVNTFPEGVLSNVANKKSGKDSKKTTNNEPVLKQDKKTIKALSKEKRGKSLSNKDRARISQFRSKYLYKETSVFTLKLKNVKKEYRNTKILKGVTLNIKKGEKVGLVGKNGSGKSTLISIISQQLKMTEGGIFYGYAKNRVQSLELMGVQFQKLEYPEGFVVKDVIHFFNASVEKKIRATKKELSDIIITFGIDGFLEQKIDKLSGGQQQRINILLAMIKKPKLLILDELSTGLDVKSFEIIKKYLFTYFEKNPKVSLLLISHSDEEIREMTDKTYVLEDGRIVEKFASSALTSSKFLEITSREIKMTAIEIKRKQEESEKLLLKLKKHYTKRVLTPEQINAESFITKYTKKYTRITNEFIDEGNFIELRDVSKTYGKSVGAVKGVNLNIKSGSRVSITGPNGSGKTTIAEILAQVKTPDFKFRKFSNLKNVTIYKYKKALKTNKENMDYELKKFKRSQNPEKAQKYEEFKRDLNISHRYENNILLSSHNKEMERIDREKSEYLKDKSLIHFKEFVMNGKVIPKMTKSVKKPQIAYSFSNNKRGVRDFTGVQFQSASFPVEMSVLDVILFFSRVNKVFMSKDEMVEAVKVFKLEKLLKQKTHKLSGGERQRLNVLLSIMKSPKLLILDEISTGLDVDSILKIDSFIKEYLDKTGSTLILISHNYHEVHSLTDKIIVMKSGELSEIADIRDWTLTQTKHKMRDIYKEGGI